MNNLLKSALYYAEHFKWSVIPLSPGAKIPPKGFAVIPYRDRVATREEIESWWKENPNYNIGIITGKTSNLFVIDHDKHKSDYSEEEALKYIPDSIVTPTATTPKGGEHQYFSFPEEDITIGTAITPGMDFRGEGGYIVAPPSVNGNGKGYEWVIKPTDVKLAAAPSTIINKIKSTIYRGVTKNENDEEGQLLQSVTINLNKGTRDDSLFHIAHTMMKGGASAQDTEIVLNLIAERCRPAFPKSEIKAKISSVLERAKRKERNIAKEVECYIAVTSGHHSVTSCYRELQAVTKEEKGSIRVAYHRLLKQGVIEKYGDKDGEYRRVEQDLDLIHFDENDPEEEPYPVKMPFGMMDLVEISEGNIVLIGGEFNSGKTTFMLNVLQMNKNLLPIRYLSSEMGKSEFRKRFRGFGVPLEWWKQDDMCIYIKRSSDFASAIDPDALNIIDYLEFKDSDYTRGAEIMTGIHDKLKKGIAVVALQKKEGVRLPRSGDMILEKPRLAITLTKEKGELDIGIAEIIKAKNVKTGKCDGKRLRYEIKDMGSRFRTLIDWGWWK